MDLYHKLSLNYNCDKLKAIYFNNWSMPPSVLEEGVLEVGTRQYLIVSLLSNKNIDWGLGEFFTKHNLIIKETTYHFFDVVILSGDLFKKALKTFPNFENKFIYKSSSKDIMAYLNKNLHKKAMIMSKCSNSTEVNKFATLLKLKKG